MVWVLGAVIAWGDIWPGTTSRQVSFSKSELGAAQSLQQASACVWLGLLVHLCCLSWCLGDCALLSLIRLLPIFLDMLPERELYLTGVSKSEFRCSTMCINPNPLEISIYKPNSDETPCVMQEHL